MSIPANLYPGLNDIADVLEEFPCETSRYLTLLHEIDAKCVHSMPNMNNKIDDFVKVEVEEDTDKTKLLDTINKLFKELMPSLEEKMHVSSIMLESLQKLTTRLEIAYEIAIKNQEIPSKLRLGVDNHPAMHLHHELMEKIEIKSNNGNGNQNGNSNGNKTSQALRSESRREAMVANKKQGTNSAINSTSANVATLAEPATQLDAPVPQQQQQHVLVTQQRQKDAMASEQENTIKRMSTSALPTDSIPPDLKKRKRRINVSTVITTTSPVPKAMSTTAVNPSMDPTISKAKTNDYGEPLYCYCNQVAYGEMVGCDGANCELEWFHLPCIHLDHLPKGKWYCNECKKNKV